MKSYTQKEMIRFLITAFAILLMAAACIVSTFLLYGGGSLASAARLEASSLAVVETSELIGTSQYEKSDHYTHHSLLSAISQTVGLPFTHPESMLSSVLPATRLPYESPPSSTSQASLFNALSNWESQTKKIALGWIQTGTTSTCIRLMKENPGITVISPSWMEVASAEGKVTNNALGPVIAYAHDHGIQVWPMFTNQFRARLTHQVLSNEDARHRLVRQTADIAKQYHFDGINVDFEAMYSDDEDLFTTFIHELHDALSPNHILLSVDITPDIVALRDTDAYFHAALAAYADYVIVMAYDEHWSTDQVPGPVADVPWVNNAVYDLLNTGVPADKLVLGMPFYTYVWYVHKDGSVSTLPVALSDVPGILDYRQVKGKWLDDLGVAYARYKKTDVDAEIWYETDETLNRKLEIVNENGLAGVAVWSLNWSDEHSWSTVMQSLRQSLS
jgi:spore germination protein YaaH